MESDILEIAAKVAGIGGLSLGVLLLIFRDIIRKNIFSTLTKQQSYKIILIIIVLVWSVAIVGIFAWIYKNKDNKVVAQTYNSTKAKLDSDYTKIDYYSEWKIKRDNLDEKIKKDILLILRFFKDKEFELAYERLQNLGHHNEFSKRFKKDFKTAILFAEGDYYGALESLIPNFASINKAKEKI